MILDEPTAPLDAHDSERLFAVVRRLKQQGIGVVFISHRIHELKAICDTLTVLRDGKLIETGPMADLNGEAIVEKMLGHELSDIYPPARPVHSDETLLRVEGLHDDALLKDISLHLRKGEILGIAGLAGAGKTELCKALFGASKSRVERGELNHQPGNRAIRPIPCCGAGAGTGGAAQGGIFIDEPVSMNGRDGRYQLSRWSLFGHRQAWRWAEEVIARVGVRTRGPGQVLRRLSGGNQQKVAIGKWLRNDASVLIFDEPTKGVDVKAKTDLFQLIDGWPARAKGDLRFGRVCRTGRAMRPHLRALGRTHRGGNPRGRGAGRDTTLLFNRRNGVVSKALSVTATVSGRQQLFDFSTGGACCSPWWRWWWFWPASDSFLDPNNIINILRSIAIVTVIAIGVSISLTVGGFDLPLAQRRRWRMRW